MMPRHSWAEWKRRVETRASELGITDGRVLVRKVDKLLLYSSDLQDQNAACAFYIMQEIDIKIAEISTQVFNKKLRSNMAKELAALVMEFSIYRLTGNVAGEYSQSWLSGQKAKEGATRSYSVDREILPSVIRKKKAREELEKLYDGKSIDEKKSIWANFIKKIANDEKISLRRIIKVWLKDMNPNPRGRKSSK